MPTKRTDENKPKRLAKGLPQARKHARAKRGGKGSFGSSSRGHTGRKMANARRVSPIVRLIQSLGKEEIRFQLVGMSAAILQGVIVTTIDTDIWVDLPERQYIKLMNLVLKQGGEALAPTLYALADGRLINFLFSVHGVRSFDIEYRRAIDTTIEGQPIKVLPLERILKSKKAIM